MKQRIHNIITIPTYIYICMWVVVCGGFFGLVHGAQAMTLSGNLYSDEGNTTITSGKTVSVAVGTSTVSLHSTTSDGSGVWTVDLGGSALLATSTPVLVWVDGDATTRASLLTKASSTDNITNLNLYQDRVIISHEGTTGTSTTISDMSFYDGDDDSDIKFTANSGVLTINAGNELHINTGKTFAPGGVVYVNGNAGSGTDGSFHVTTDATYTPEGNTYIAGSLTASTSAVFTESFHGLIFNATTTGKTITAPTSTLPALAFTGTGTHTFSTPATTTNVTIQTGATVVAPASTLTLTGGFINNGTFTHSSGELKMNNTALTEIIGMDVSGNSTGSDAGWFVSVQSIASVGTTLYIAKYTDGNGTPCSQEAGSAGAIACELMVFDISSSTNPIYVKGIDSSGDTSGIGNGTINSLITLGSTLYVGKVNDGTACSQTAGSADGCELMVFDISSTTNPVYVKGLDASGSTAGTGAVEIRTLATLGSILYVGKGGDATACSQTAGSADGCELMVFDISSTTNPVYVKGLDASGNTSGTGSVIIRTLTTVGSTLYVGKESDYSSTACSQVAGSAGATACELMVFDISSTTNPVYVKGLDALGNTTGNGNTNIYALAATDLALYLGRESGGSSCSQVPGSAGAGACGIMIFDISSTTNPRYTKGIYTSSIYALTTLGPRLFVGKLGGSAHCTQSLETSSSCELIEFDISSSTNPIYTKGFDASGNTTFGVGGEGMSDINSLAIVGATLYAGKSWSVVSTCSQVAGYADGCELLGFSMSQLLPSSLQGTLTNSSALSTLTIGGATTTLVSTASTTNFTMNTGASAVQENTLSVSGNYTQNGAVQVNGDTIFDGISSQTISGTHTGVSSFSDITLRNAGTKTFSSNASTTGDFVIESTSGAVTAPTSLTITGSYTNESSFTAPSANLSLYGDYTNTGTFTAGSGTTTWNGIALADFVGMDSSGNTTGTGGVLINSLTTLGSTLYVGKGGDATACSQVASSAIGCELMVFDISSTTNPRYVKGLDISGNTTGTSGGSGGVTIASLTISGSALYVGKYEFTLGACSQTAGSAGATACELMVFDISSTTNPRYVKGLDISGNTTGAMSGGIGSLTSIGSTLYAGSYGGSTACSQTAGSAQGCELMVFDISSTTNPIYTKGLDSSGNTTGTRSDYILTLTTLGSTLYVGKQGYDTSCSQTAGSAAGCELMVFDISSTTNPRYVKGLDASGNTTGTESVHIYALTTLGSTLYVGKAANATACSQTAGSAAGCELMAFDISSTTNPVYAKGLDISGDTTGIIGAVDIRTLAALGSTLYVGKAANATACSQTAGSAMGCELMAFDIGSTTNPVYVKGLDASGNTTGTGNATIVSLITSSSTLYVGKEGNVTACSQTAGSAIGCELMSFRTDAKVSGTLTGSSAFNDVEFRIGTTTLMDTASTSDVTVATGATLVAPATELSISGNYTNSGTFTHNSGTATFSGTSAQTATGTMTGNSAFGNTSFTGGGVKTFITNASTSNFMVDTGATVVAPAELSVAGNYTNNGTTTHQGARWVARSAAGNDDSWWGVTYGNGLFVAVGWGSDVVMTSPDGITWTAHSAAGNNDTWNSVTYGNGLFVAVGDYGDHVMYSTNGTTWATTTAAGDNDEWNSVTYGNGLFVAVGDSGDRVMYSSDGIMWATTTAAGDNDSWTSVTYGNGLFVAVVNSASGDHVMTSFDGISWATTTAVGDNDRWTSITYGNGLFVAVGYSGDFVMTSPDGITWTARSAAGNNDSWASVTYGNGLFVAGATGASGDHVMYSSDGITWATTTAVGDNDRWESITYGNGLFVAVSYLGDRVMTSVISTTTFNGTTPQTIGGTLSGASTFGNVAFTSGTTTTFTNNASTSNFTVSASSTAIAPASLTLSGNYINNGTTTHSGTTTLSGTTRQTLQGNMVGTSAFNTLIIENTSENASTTEEAVSFLNIASTTGTFIMRAGTSAQFLANATSTFQNINLTGTTTASSTRYVTLRSTTAGSQFTISVPGTQSVITADVKDSNACPTTITVDYTSLDSGNNTCWVFATLQTLAGFLYSDEGSILITSGKDIAIVVGTSTVTYATTTDGSGAWIVTIGDSHTTGASTPILVYVDGDATTRAALFTKASSTSSINNLDLYQNRVIVSHEDATTSTSTTISDMSFYDGDDDSDIQFNASSTANTLTINTGNELHIKEGKAFMPGGSIYINGNGQPSATDGSFHVPHNATFVAGATTSIAGNFNASSSATLYPYGNLEFTASTTGKTINATSTPLGNIVFNNTQPVTFVSNATTTNITINTGATVVAPSNLTITGDYTNNNGTFTHNNGTTTFMNNGDAWVSRSASNDNDIWRSVTYGNGIFVAVGDYGDRVMTSSDGITWTARSAAGDNDAWYSVTYGNGIFVAVSCGPMTAGCATSGGGDRVMTSSNGTAWTARSAAGDNDYWYSVTYGNGIFVAVGPTGDRVMYSSDGITWATTTAAGNDDGWQAVTYNDGLFVAVGNSGDRVMYSSNGITWATTTAAGDDDYWNSVTYGNGLFVAVGDYGNRVMTSTDGITWTARSAAGDDDGWNSVTYSDGLFAAVGDYGNRVMTSPDGITWTARSIMGKDTNWRSITYGNGLFVAVSFFGSGNAVMTATRGTITIGGGMQSATGTMTGTSAWHTFVSTGTTTHKTHFSGHASTTNLIIEKGQLSQGSTLSIEGSFTNSGQFNAQEGALWATYPAVGNNDYWNSVTYGNGLFVAVGNTGDRVMTSSDGITWATTTAAGNDDYWLSVTYGNGIFVAVGYVAGDRVMYSSDGITWATTTAAGNNDNWYSVTYGNGIFVAVGDSGDRVMYSSDGITWATTTAAGNNDFWKSVTYGNGLFVAVGTGGSGDHVMYSSDGITWATTTAAGNNDYWYEITYGSGLFVAVSYSGDRVMTSSDGVTWTARTAAGDNDAWYSITYGNGLFVAVSGRGDRVMTSSDGINWTTRPVPKDAGSWSSITYGDGLFVAVSYATGDCVMTSLLGTTTFNGTSAQTITGNMTGANAFGNVAFTESGTKTFNNNASSSNFNVGSGATVVASTSLTVAGNYTVDTGATVVAPAELSVSGSYTNNGTTTHQGARWIARSAAGNNDYWRAITYGNGLFVAVGDSGDRVITSPDGINWTARSAAGNNDDWWAITYGNGLFVAVGNNGGDRVMTSPDGITWTARSAAGNDDSWKGVTYGNGLFVAVGIGPDRVMYSSDGITWATATAVGDDDNWWGVTYGNGLFVAVGPVGDRIMTSPDGINWATTTVTGNDLRSVTFGNGLFVAVSNSGDRVMYSSDGITWTSHSAAGNNDSWWGVTYGNGLFVAVGSGPDVVMTSSDGITWTPHSAAGDNDGWESVTYGNGLFVAVGYVNDRVMTSAISTTTFNGTTPQTIGGTLSGASAFGNVAFTSGTTTTFMNNASTSNFTVSASSTVTLPASLTLSGDYRNNGTTTHTGIVTLSGTTVQTLSGTLTGTSAFNDLILANQSTNGSSTEKAVIFQSSASTTGTFTMLPGTSVQLFANATSTFQNILLMGSSTASSTQYATVRSTASGTQATISVAGTQSVTYADIQDSNACPTTITANDGTNLDSGNNTCWSFTILGSALSSAANQIFGYGTASTPIETITITDEGTITIANDIRIRIATSSANMLWDTNDTTATFGGTASGKVENPVSYEENGTILVISVTDDFTSGDTLTISDLSFTSFTAVNTPATALGLRTTGTGTTTSTNDNRTIAIYGTLTLDTHGDGQVSDNFDHETETTIPLHAFRLVPAGEYMDVTALSFALTGVRGVNTDDLTNVRLYRDTNSDGAYDGGDIQVGGDGVDTITDQTGSIVFSTTFTASTTADYILTADLANLENRDALIVSLDTAYLTIVGTTTGNGIKIGSALSIQHIRGGGGGGSISLVIGGAPPAGDGIRTGGDEGGIDPNTGDSIGSETDAYAPSANGTPFSAWTSGANAYSSDGVYTTTDGSTQHSYGNFGFSVPSNNQITGIKVKVEASGSTAAGDISVRLSWNGGGAVTSLQTTNTLTTTDAIYTLGGPSDDWGHSWTPAELDNGNFTIEIVGNPSGNTISIDAIQVRVFHQATGGGGGGGGGAVFKYDPDRFFANVYSAWSERVGGVTEAFIGWLVGLGR